MIKFLRDSKCIDFSKLLLLKGKELNISDHECHVLQLILALKEVEIKTITPQLILEYSMLTNKQMDEILSSLMKKKLIYNHMGSIRLNKIEEVLLQESKVPEETVEINLIEVYEAEFARSLSPMELSYIRTWKQEYGYDDETILLALKEAVKSQVLSFRYIEAILNNWSKTGVSTRYVETPSQEDDIEVSEYAWWQDE